jgi:MFS family permease
MNTPTAHPPTPTRAAGKARAGRVFYGYWIVLAAVIIQMVLNGCGMYAFSLFVKPLETSFGWTRAGVMMSFVVYNIALAFTSPWVGRLVDRHEPRRVMAAGAVVMGLGLGLLGTIGQVWQYSALWGVVGVGVAGTGFVPMTAVLFRWFRRRRGLAVGLMGVGIGAGGFAIAPAIGTVLIPQLGWRGAFYVLGVAVPAVVVPLAMMVLRSRPEELGLTADGLSEADGTGGQEAIGSVSPLPRAEDGLSLAAALRMRSFWLLVTCFAAFGFAMNSIFQNHVPHLQDIGFPVAAAASALSAVGIGSATGKFLFGWLCDLIRPRYVFVMGVLLQLAGVLILMTVRSDSTLSAVWLYASLYGIGIGCWPVMSMVVSSTFGMAHYGTVYGAFNMVWTLGSSVGAPMAGYIRDLTGSYRLAFAIFAVAFLVTIPSVLLAVRPAAANAAVAPEAAA